jgi:hypothetical protein
LPTADPARAAGRQLSRVRLGLALAVVLGTLPPSAVGGAEPAPANRRLTPPDSRLNRPEAAPPYICGHLAGGGTFSHDQGQYGYGGSVVFHPVAAADFLDFLYAWNTGLVLQADWLSLGGGGRVLSADLILRRYLAERGDEHTSLRPFVGAGFGASSAWPGDEGSAPGLKYWSLVLEGGQEWELDRRVLLLFKGQVRVLNQDGVDWSTWSVLAGIGLPFPW